MGELSFIKRGGGGDDSGLQVLGTLSHANEFSNRTLSIGSITLPKSFNEYRRIFIRIEAEVKDINGFNNKVYFNWQRDVGDQKSIGIYGSTTYIAGSFIVLYCPKANFDGSLTFVNDTADQTETGRWGGVNSSELEENSADTFNTLTFTATSSSSNIYGRNITVTIYGE